MRARARCDGDRVVGRAGSRTEQPQHMAAEAPADDPGADGARVEQALHRRLDGRGGDRIAVAQAGVRGVEQLADARQVAVAQRRDRVAHTLVLGDDVAGAIGKGLGQALDHLERRVAQAGDRQKLARALALVAPLVVTRLHSPVLALAPGVGVALPGVQGDERVPGQLQLDRGDLQRAEVDLERPLGLPEERRDLIEQAGASAHPLVLDPRADPRQLEAIGHRRIAGRQQRQGQRHLEGGR